MSTTLECISILESIVGAVTTDFSKWNRRKLISVLNEGRAVGISNTHQGGTRIHPDWLQPFTIEYNELLQTDSCFSIFPCPSVIKLSKTKDGFIQIGNAEGTVNYKRFNTIGELNNAKDHPILSRALTVYVGALYEDSVWKIYAKDVKIKSFGGRAIFNDPTEVPHFNILKDKYPIDETTFEFVCGYLKEKYLNQIEQTPVTTTHTDKQFSISSKRR